MQLASRLVGVDELLVGYISKHSTTSTTHLGSFLIPTCLDKTEAAVLNPKNKSAPKRWTHYDLIIITGGSTTHDKLTDVKRAVVGTIEDALRKPSANPMLAAIRKHSGPDAPSTSGLGGTKKKKPPKRVGVVATQPPETRATTRWSLTTHRMTKLASVGSAHGRPDFQISADDRRQLGLLNDEVQALLKQYSVRTG
ncbi:Aste57867_14387 [Aphanomyces stellatus]|uniref:Aste57867_14387 protein n=1 Tax=Aphanomyces stellatus TaxID=120398 RepID=A0A485L0H4_9STRA|nr:hypothetical protein As57867_014333 [Aphanomyces stellatus]VFT91210.1 Aste57867_14387 [Aphanomyces stellatus]